MTDNRDELMAKLHDCSAICVYTTDERGLRHPHYLSDEEVAALRSAASSAAVPVAPYGTDKIDALSAKKLSCRQLAQYVWDRAHEQPMCFEQDIARLFENERKGAAERAIAHHKLATPVAAGVRET